MLTLKPQITLSTQDKKLQYAKKLLTTKYRKGLSLFAYNFDTNEVYLVEIEASKEFNCADIGKSRYSANVNKEHLHVWALNISNAERKIFKILESKL